MFEARPPELLAPLTRTLHQIVSNSGSCEPHDVYKFTAICPAPVVFPAPRSVEDAPTRSPSSCPSLWPSGSQSAIPSSAVILSSTLLPLLRQQRSHRHFALGPASLRACRTLCVVQIVRLGAVTSADTIFTPATDVLQEGRNILRACTLPPYSDLNLTPFQLKVCASNTCVPVSLTVRRTSTLKFRLMPMFG